MVAHSGEEQPKTGADIAGPMLVAVMVETRGRLKPPKLDQFVAGITGVTVEDVAMARADAERQGVLLATLEHDVVNSQSRLTQTLARTALLETVGGPITIGQMRGFLDRWRDIDARSTALEIEMARARITDS